MKFITVVFLATVSLVLCSVEGRFKKKKYESDFVFAEDVDNKDPKDANNKKKWIHDPESDLCVPLKCKKKELCLLENLYTAVCVSKKELHKNGDIIMSKSRYLAEEAKKKASVINDTLDDDDDDDDDDDMDEDEDDDIFYDSSKSFSINTENTFGENTLQKCNSCPIMKPTFLCGSDNRTYSSLCRLDYHNCLHRSTIKVACKGFCPCKESKKNEPTSSVGVFNKNKYTGNNTEKPKKKIDIKAPQPVVDKYSLIPEDFKYENKHYKYIKYTKNDPVNPYKFFLSSTKTPYYYDKDRLRGENEVIDEKPEPVKTYNKKKECPDTALQSMGNRLLDWFSVIMADNKRRRTDYKGKQLIFPKGCKAEVGWMFKHLDLDADGQLTLQELYDLEHDQNEHCMKPFLDMCDTNRDIFVSPFEWCHCFMKSERPCMAVKKRIPPHVMPGVYVPMCDNEGYYQPMQCHGMTGMCWCVNKHGVEFSNSRTYGKVDCDLYFISSGVTEKSSVGYKKSDSNKSVNNDLGNGNSGTSSKNKMNFSDSGNDDDDDDDSDDNDDFNGSGDQPLDFGI